ncbi:BEACH domain-containing protein LvsA-like protein [Tanacetum coccineum]|uniref:BEACH domain-containing protein LvsA-like protein n=1 Tax=Tanacetum coccineum TaxID=301880 RepID=A0ABQ5GJ22_9ASTR
MDTIHQMIGGHESIAVASMCAWFTPTILFCVSNLIIATLFIASKSNTNTTKHYDHYQNHDHDINESSVQGYSFTPRIPRVSSFLERAKSINLSSCIPTITTTKIVPCENTPISKTAKYTSLSRLAQSIHSPCSYDTQPDSPRYPSNKKPYTQIFTNLTGQLAQVPSIVQVKRFKSKTPKEKISAVEIKKTRSEVRHVSDDEDDVNMRRPETARARRNADDDAKAENFITKFREQLKLQRMDSINRHNDMLRPSS